MRVSIKFKIVFLIVTLLNVLDVFSTYYVTPDLSYEGNYWVRKYSLGWNGLLLVLIIYQILNLAIFFYHSDKFKARNYQIRVSNSIFDVFKVYLFNSSNPKLNYESILILTQSVVNYLGLHFICLYIVGKIIAITDNLLVGTFLRRVTILNKKGGITNVQIDILDPFWETNSGRFLKWFSSLQYSVKMDFINNVLIIFGFLVLIIFIKKTFRHAISTCH